MRRVQSLKTWRDWAIWQRRFATSHRAGAILAAIFSVALCACGAEAPSADAFDDERAAEGRVVSVPDGHTLILDTGLEVRLAFIRAPGPAQGRAPAEPGYAEARNALAELTLGRVPALEPPADAADARDRHGRLIALAVVSDLVRQPLIQARLTQDGLVRVDPEISVHEAASEDGADILERTRALLRFEDEARAASRGIWREPYYAVRDAEAASASAGAFQIVQGQLVDAAQVRGVTYLNFGPDYRSDFTGVIARDVASRFDIERLLAAPGARLRLRGLVTSRNGPMIELTQPTQIEWLVADETPPALER